jgi:LmbE family N-acetylglucosaminyl deacetylase
LYWHPDHIGVHERATTAIRTMGGVAPPLYYVTMPRGVMPDIVARARAAGWTPGIKGVWSLQPEAFGLHALRPTIVVDVAEWVPQKLAAIECHQSQIGSDHPFARMGADEARRLLGVEYFTRADVPTSAAPVLERLCDTTR